MQLSFVRAGSIFLANPDGTDQRAVLRARVVLPSCLATRYDDPAWSSAGNLAVTHIDNQDCGSHDWWNVAVRLRGVKRLTQIATGSSWGATWAPDSQRIVFAAFVSDPNVHQPLFIARISKPRSTSRVKASEPLASENPSWSPDGRTIAFAGEASGPDSAIYLTDPQGKRLSRLAGHAHDPGWSPDSRQIVFEDKGRLYIVNADGTKRRLLYEPSHGQAVNPAWSPDGKLIAFSLRGSVWAVTPQAAQRGCL